MKSHVSYFNTHHDSRAVSEICFVCLPQVDVNGECSAEYEVKARHNSSRVKTILKSKDLSLCKDRSETNLGIPVTHYPTDKVGDN